MGEPYPFYAIRNERQSITLAPHLSSLSILSATIKRMLKAAFCVASTGKRRERAIVD
jgi:precorrin-6B methylase 1